MTTVGLLALIDRYNALENIQFPREASKSFALNVNAGMPVTFLLEQILTFGRRQPAIGFAATPMINIPTVFVLGAGASHPYGYPTGPGLIEKILGNHSDVEAALGRRAIATGALKPFQDALRESSLPSIDTFLEHRPDLQELGKLLIAAHILRCQVPGELSGGNDHWYQLLLTALRGGPFEQLNFDNVAIVTFNYDRSLEQFLFRALCSGYDKQYKVVADKLKTLRIIHIHGHVGDLDWQRAGGREYRPDLNPHDVAVAAKGIRIISEAGDDEVLIEARQRIETAKRVFLLGMAYHDDNMRRLGFPRACDEANCHTWGSAFRLSSARCEIISAKYKVMLGHAGSMCREYLDNNRYFLEMDN